MIKKFTYKLRDWYRSSPNRMVFTIPIGNISREEAEEQIRQLMSKYHEKIEFPEGVIVKSNNIDNNKDIWYPNIPNGM